MKIKNISLRFLILFFGVFLYSGFFYFQNSYLDYLFNFKKEGIYGKDEIFIVNGGDNLYKISKNLKDKNLIKSSFLFDLYVKKNKKENELKAGKYLFNKSMSLSEIADSIIFGKVVLNKIKITIPEGLTVKQIDDRFIDYGVKLDRKLSTFKVSEFKSEYDFLSGVDENNSLEGFLFPDTYEYDKDKISGRLVASGMLNNFEKKVKENILYDIEKQEKKLFDVLIMASILEKEVKTRKDMEIVAGILYKRMKNEMPLQVDATTLYEIKEGNLSDNLKIKSKYNTYLNKGLPKGPISNPGIKAIESAVYPKDSPYWFYLSKPNGETVFSENFKKHKDAIYKYLK